MTAEREQLKEYYSMVFGTIQGRAVMADILEHCKVGRTLWAVDQRQQNANVVKHDVGMYIKGMAEDD